MSVANNSGYTINSAFINHHKIWARLSLKRRKKAAAMRSNMEATLMDGVLLCSAAGAWKRSTKVHGHSKVWKNMHPAVSQSAVCSRLERLPGPSLSSLSDISKKKPICSEDNWRNPACKSTNVIYAETIKRPQKAEVPPGPRWKLQIFVSIETHVKLCGLFAAKLLLCSLQLHNIEFRIIWSDGV